jgi:integrase
MASVTFRLSEKGGKDNDRPEFRVWFRYGTPQRRISCRTGLYGFRDYWSEKKQKHNTKLVNPLFSAEVIEVNDKLSTLRTKIETAADNTPDNAISRDWLLAIVEDYLHPTKKEEVQQDAPKTLIQAFEDFIAAAPTTTRRCGKQDKIITKRRLKFYEQTLRILKEMGADGVTIERTDKAFYDSFYRYMFDNGFKHNTFVAYTKCIKAVINSLPSAERFGCEFVQPKKCATVMEDIDNIYLDETELKALADLDLDGHPYLDRVRDQFLLLAWTGCRYSDLGKLSRKYIVTKDDDDWFYLEQQKTGAKVLIPILPPIVPILEKYDYQPPKPISNQKFNNYIKEVARLAGFDSEVVIRHTQQMEDSFEIGTVETRLPKWQAVTAHSARRSFATNLYNRDYPTLEIMAVTGHRTEAAFLSYIKISQEDHVKRLKQKFMAQWK